MPTYEKKWTERLQLTNTERQELEQLRDHSPKPYMRERGAAILKVADGQDPEQVAKNGLLKRRNLDTLYRWLERYAEEGVNGLYIRSGRGRKPAFSPSGRGDGSGAGDGEA